MDVCKATAEKFNIEAMPTFCFVKNQELVGQVRGADPQKLLAKITELAGGGVGGAAGPSEEEEVRGLRRTHKQESHRFYYCCIMVPLIFIATWQSCRTRESWLTIIVDLIYGWLGIWDIPRASVIVAFLRVSSDSASIVSNITSLFF